MGDEDPDGPAHFASPPCFGHKMASACLGQNAVDDGKVENDILAWRKAERDRIIAAGGTCSLPVVFAKEQPLVFRRWQPGDVMERGVWNIPIPAPMAGQVTPDILQAPVVGLDPGSYRLGYGGGYFDRPLAALPERPEVIGVGFGESKIRTIYPLPHDIPMDRIITEDGVATARDPADPTGRSAPVR